MHPGVVALVSEATPEERAVFRFTLREVEGEEEAKPPINYPFPAFDRAGPNQVTIGVKDQIQKSVPGCS